MQSSTYLKLLSALIVGQLLLVMMVNWYLDPMLSYHRPYVHVGYSDNQRYQNPGLARNLDYAACFIGTSKTENHSGDHLSQLTGERVLMLPVAGSTIREQNELLQVALRSGKPRRVYWEMNYGSISAGERINDGSVDFPHYMYVLSAVTVSKYLLSMDTLREGILGLSGQRHNDFDSLHFWTRNYDHSAPRMEQAWAYVVQRWTPELRQQWDAVRLHTPADLNAIMQRHIESLLIAYPQVEFELILLPASRRYYLSDFLIAPNRSELRLSMRRTLAEWLQRHDNLKVHDLQLHADYMQPQHYKDLDHYAPEISARISADLASGRFVVDSTSLQANNDALQTMITEELASFCRQTECPPPLQAARKARSMPLPRHSPGRL